jgi:hypothetical protein
MNVIPETYLMNVIPETHRAHYIRYLSFIIRRCCTMKIGFVTNCGEKLKLEHKD